MKDPKRLNLRSTDLSPERVAGCMDIFRTAVKLDPMVAEIMILMAEQGDSTPLRIELEERVRLAMNRAVEQLPSKELGRTKLIASTSTDESGTTQVTFQAVPADLKRYILSAVRSGVERSKMLTTIRQQYGNISSEEIRRQVAWAERKIREESEEKLRTRKRLSKAVDEYQAEAPDPDMVRKLMKLKGVPDRIRKEFLAGKYNKQKMDRILLHYDGKTIYDTPPEVLELIRLHPNVFGKLKNLRENLISGKYNPKDALAYAQSAVEEYGRKK